jgi:hypothetical protein
MHLNYPKGLPSQKSKKQPILNRSQEHQAIIESSILKVGDGPPGGALLELGKLNAKFGIKHLSTRPS